MDGVKIEPVFKKIISKSRSETYANFFKAREPSRYSHKVLRCAANLFAALRPKEDLTTSAQASRSRAKEGRQVVDHEQKSLKLPDMRALSDAERRLSFDLACSALKYCKLLDHMVDRCNLFSDYTELADQEGLTFIVLFDMLKRKFESRVPQPGETLDATITETEALLSLSGVKLNAALAKRRIEAKASKLEFLLPEKVRQRDEFGGYGYVYTWVNRCKISISGALDSLKADDFTVVSDRDQLIGRSVYVDSNCTDLFVFPNEIRDDIVNHPMVLDKQLVIQDKSCCLGVSSVFYLVNLYDDTVIARVGSGITAIHLASLMTEHEGTVFACGVESSDHARQLRHLFQEYRVTNIQLIEGSFMKLPPDDPRLVNARVVYLNTQCSRSGVVNLVDFVLSEGQDGQMIQEMLLADNKSGRGRLANLSATHFAMLKYCMFMPRVQAVVYSTFSVHEPENEQVVQKGLEFSVVAKGERMMPFNVCPPVLPLTESDTKQNEGTVDKFLKFSPSKVMSGCFVAILTKEPTSEKRESQKDILARAQALFESDKRKKKKKGKAAAKAAAAAAGGGGDDDDHEGKAKHKKRRTGSSIATLRRSRRKTSSPVFRPISARGDERTPMTDRAASSKQSEFSQRIIDPDFSTATTSSTKTAGSEIPPKFQQSVTPSTLVGTQRQSESLKIGLQLLPNMQRRTSAELATGAVPPNTPYSSYTIANFPPPIAPRTDPLGKRRFHHTLETPSQPLNSHLPQRTHALVK